MKKLGQKGFGLVEGLLIIIALSLVVGVGYYVYNASQDKKDDTKASETTQTDAKPVEQKKEYLEFPKVGVKVKNTDDLKDITFEELAGDNGGHYIDYSSKKVGDLFRECVNKNRNAFVEPTADETIKQMKDRVGSIYRINGSYDEIAKNRASTNSALLRDFGAFFLEAPGGPAPCIALDDETTDDAYILELNKTQETVNNAFKNAENLQ